MTPADRIDALFVERLVRQRCSLQLTQQQLADRAQIPVSVLSQIEGGTRKPSFGKALLLAGALELPVAELLAPGAWGVPV